MTFFQADRHGTWPLLTSAGRDRILTSSAGCIHAFPRTAAPSLCFPSPCRVSAEGGVCSAVGSPTGLHGLGWGPHPFANRSLEGPRHTCPATAACEARMASAGARGGAMVGRRPPFGPIPCLAFLPPKPLCLKPSLSPSPHPHPFPPCTPNRQ